MCPANIPSVAGALQQVQAWGLYLKLPASESWPPADSAAHHSLRAIFAYSKWRGDNWLRRGRGRSWHFMELLQCPGHLLKKPSSSCPQGHMWCRSLLKHPWSTAGDTVQMSESLYSVKEALCGFEPQHHINPAWWPVLEDWRHGDGKTRRSRLAT